MIDPQALSRSESQDVLATDGGGAPKARGSFVYWSLAALFFATAAVALTWPLAAGLDEGISLGTETVALQALSDSSPVDKAVDTSRSSPCRSNALI